MAEDHSSDTVACFFDLMCCWFELALGRCAKGFIEEYYVRGGSVYPKARQDAFIEVTRAKADMLVHNKRFLIINASTPFHIALYRCGMTS